MSGDLSASVAPRGGAFVLANMTNPHLAPPSPVGGVVGHNIDRRITILLFIDSGYIFQVAEFMLQHSDLSNRRLFST